MAAVSAWAKPGSLALESSTRKIRPATSAYTRLLILTTLTSPSSAFPSLSAAAVTKIPKKKKKQTLTLAEFNAGTTKFQPSYKTLVPVELLSLPTGPRERSEEELQRPRGFGYFNGGGGRGGSSRVSDENPEKDSSGTEANSTPSRVMRSTIGSMRILRRIFERRISIVKKGSLNSQSRVMNQIAGSRRRGLRLR
ncbi:uncharacterized protein A4U43_C04F8200 [Asparagus officinalis]|uniref:Uncharacterized protein n=1 Tax=Asparagus officinalis TaxID=4686 RepID=A0A5P1EZU6_ASPOF|nr:uncharacterized protein A4U43_C04F8200 [Asparagus officinalis]